MDKSWVPLTFDNELGGWVLLGKAVIDEETVIRHRPGYVQIGNGGVATFFVRKEQEVGKDEAQIDDFVDFAVDRGMMNKPYDVVLTPSICSFLDIVAEKIEQDAGWVDGSLLPPGVIQIDEKALNSFRKLYMFDFVTQAQKWARNPDEMVMGSQYKNMLVLGSPDLPDGNFYVQYLILRERNEEREVSPMNLAKGLFRIRHFVVSIYDYSNGKWPDGWYRITKVAGPASVDYISPVRSGRIDNGRGAALLWMQNPPDGVPYNFERVRILDEEQTAVVRDALKSVTNIPSDELDTYWIGETHWVNIFQQLEQTLKGLST